MCSTSATAPGHSTLNESPSEKEGKYIAAILQSVLLDPSMKVPPKRKGNAARSAARPGSGITSMKVPPKRKGNKKMTRCGAGADHPSMKVPPKRKGNATTTKKPKETKPPSMKVPPKRKGNKGQ